MKQPLLSILMPVKNTEEFLNECLNSVLKQDYINWELVAVDDHSDDNSPVILRQFAAQDNRIKVFKNQGRGITEALRTAFQKASGEFISRMDSDDIMPPQKLSVLCDNLLASGKGHLATGLVRYFSEGELGNGYKNYEKWLNKLTLTGSNFNELYRECVIPSPCWMVYREDFEKCGAFRSDWYPEDYDLCFRFYEMGLKCLPCNDVLHMWRDSPGRTSRHDPNYADNRFLKLKIHYFLKLNYDSSRPLVIWGAGKKGKYLARELVELKIPFSWVCNNEKKIGQNIYGKIMESEGAIDELEDPQIIVLIAEPMAKKEIQDIFDRSGIKPMADYFFFC